MWEAILEFVKREVGNLDQRQKWGTSARWGTSVVGERVRTTPVAVVWDHWKGWPGPGHGSTRFLERMRCDEPGESLDLVAQRIMTSCHPEGL